MRGKIPEICKYVNKEHCSLDDPNGCWEVSSTDLVPKWGHWVKNNDTPKNLEEAFDKAIRVTRREISKLELHLEGLRYYKECYLEDLYGKRSKFCGSAYLNIDEKRI